MKAIYIKYLPATTHRGTRVKATDNDGNSVTASRNYALNLADQGAEVALALCVQMEWKPDLIGNGDVFLFANENRHTIAVTA